MNLKEKMQVWKDTREYPYEHPFVLGVTDVPTLAELLHWKEFDEVWGANALAIYHQCPRCLRPAVWHRHHYCLCYHCEYIFDWLEEPVMQCPDCSIPIPQVGEGWKCPECRTDWTPDSIAEATYLLSKETS